MLRAQNLSVSLSHRQAPLRDLFACVLVQEPPAERPFADDATSTRSLCQIPTPLWSRQAYLVVKERFWQCSFARMFADAFIVSIFAWLDANNTEGTDYDMPCFRSPFLSWRRPYQTRAGIWVVLGDAQLKPSPSQAGQLERVAHSLTRIAPSRNAECKYWYPVTTGSRNRHEALTQMYIQYIHSPSFSQPRVFHYFLPIEWYYPYRETKTS